MKELLEHSIDALPEDYRTVYMMREIEEMSTKDTAHVLQISESNVKIRLMRAKKKLRDSLESRVKDAAVYEFLGERCDSIIQNVMTDIYSKEN